jgi:hypothetical protein
MSARLRGLGARSATRAHARWGRRARGGAWMGWASVAVAVAALLSLAGCGASRPRARLGALDVTGIGEVSFGQSSRRVRQRLDQLLGRSGSASRVFRGRGPKDCGFDREIVWSGLATTPTIGPTVGLTVYLERSRFVGYAYGPPYGGPGVEPVRQGPVLATAAGLGLGDGPHRGHQLYGDAFIATTQPQGTPPEPSLPRLPAWEARTATGRLGGYIDQASGHPSPVRVVIGSISAGVVPNTPCH